ncbi:putative hydrolase of the HAD superfamily [Virgibacillus halotolerans]|uniref:HAD family hydrolase n=1 Tax=Virgibacillus halotolerans TaxID=1071053 RepID=UPI001960618E|nr:HAD family hydrolase [Virgibacillus halotolerans]MBM7599427.1 putative hydrolase of the HAD superfamily [Virgibacillus halotolerans]
MLKAILFDLDDTLLWDEKSIKAAMEVTCEMVHEKYGILPEVVEEKVRENARAIYATYDTYTFTQMIGINPFEGLWGNFADKGADFQRLHDLVPGYRKEVWRKSLQDLGIEDIGFGDELAETFPKARKSHQYIYEDTFKVLDQLKGKYQLLMLTNGSPELQRTKLAITPELVPYFQHIVISGDYGKGKPDQGIFKHALELLSVSKDEALMVGDNLMTDILGASRTGIKSVWINRHQRKHGEVAPTYEVSNLEALLPIIEKL